MFQILLTKSILIMKNQLLSFTLIVNVFLMNAQLNEPCATPESSGSDPAGVYSYSDDLPTLENYTPMVFNVFFWGINKNDGTSNYPLTETTALSAVAKLNIEYNSFGIFFKYYGIHTAHPRRKGYKIHG